MLRVIEETVDFAHTVAIICARSSIVPDLVRMMPLMAAPNPAPAKNTPRIKAPAAIRHFTQADRAIASNEIITKFLELSKEAVPSLTRLAVLFSTERTVNGEHKAAMAAAARSLRIELDEVEVGRLSDLTDAIRRAKERGAEALFVWPTGFAFTFAKQISDVALTNRLPSVHPYTEGARAGGLLRWPGFHRRGTTGGSIRRQNTEG